MVKLSLASNSLIPKMLQLHCYQEEDFMFGIFLHCNGNCNRPLACPATTSEIPVPGDTIPCLVGSHFHLDVFGVLPDLRHVALFAIDASKCNSSEKRYGVLNLYVQFLSKLATF